MAQLIGCAAVLATATGCPPQPTGVSTPPVILDSSVSPSTVVAGDLITVTVTASDGPYSINSLGIGLTGPNGAKLPPAGQSDACSSVGTAVAVSNGAQGIAEFTISCRIPTFATNGAWNVRTAVGSIGRPSPTAAVTLPIEVVGGSDDTAAPVVTTIEAVPPTVARGSSFDVRFRVEDANLQPGSTAYPYGFVQLSPDLIDLLGVLPCERGDTTQVSETVIESVATCHVAADQRSGPYTSYFEIEDLLGFRTRVDLTTTVL